MRRWSLLFDWIMEPTAVQLGFWKWLPAGEIPLYNFICWFVISALLQTAFRLFKFPKPNQFAVHLLIIELLFSWYYKHFMSWIIYPLIALATFFIMEGITWLTHKYVMHGFLWFCMKTIIKSFLKKNDAFFVILLFRAGFALCSKYE